MAYPGISAITRLEKRFRTLLFISGYSVLPELCSNLSRCRSASVPLCLRVSASLRLPASVSACLPVSLPPRLCIAALPAVACSISLE